MRGARQGKLLSGYGFTCACPACDLGAETGRLSESARMAVQGLLGRYAEGSDSGPEAELRVIRAFIQMLESEGIAGREVSTL